MNTKNNLVKLIVKHESEILEDWMEEQLSATTRRSDLISEADLKQQSRDFLKAFVKAAQGGDLLDIMAPHWENVRSILDRIAKSRTLQGFTPSETATFVFSLKKPLFMLLEKELEKDPEAFFAQVWIVTVLIDKLGLFATERFLQSREEIITRQQDEILELSTPVVKIWDQILTLPLIGTLDSARTQVVMENLLQEIVSTSSSVAIIDITGVPVVDTLVAQHLIKTVAAARLMGADCIISGIRPQIAQTMVHLGVVFGDIVTKATLADALRHAFAITGWKTVRSDTAP